ncbi:MAG: ATP-binding protein, partial [Pseudomonas sp.]
MLKILVRLYLVIIVAYAGALLLIPDAIVGAFHDRFIAYNLNQAKGVQKLIVERFRQVPADQWPAVEHELAADFAPLEIELRRQDQIGLSHAERSRLAAGENVVRLGDWGYYKSALAPLDPTWAVELRNPPDPLDINLISWGVTVLIVAALLGCLLLWVWPHWRDLE